jgi:hypothetical protein
MHERVVSAIINVLHGSSQRRSNLYNYQRKNVSDKSNIEQR